MKQFTLRRPKALSPSSLLLWESDPTEFFLKYLAPVAPPPFKQTLPMAIGSAFDSFVKGAIARGLGYGKDTLSLIRESVEVEGEAREQALSIGWYLFGEYTRLGYLAALMSDLEVTDKGSVVMEQWCSGTIHGVPLHGKPDLSVLLPTMGGSLNNIVVMLDWKCNGIMAKRKTSPKAGWIRSTHVGRNGHKGVIVLYNGMRVAKDGSLDDTWALQTCTYSWARAGGLVKEGLLCGVDQLTGMGEETLALRRVHRAGGRVDEIMIPAVRISSFRNLVTYEAQLTYIERYATLWRLLCLPDDELMAAWFPSLGAAGSISECRGLVRGAEYMGVLDSDRRDV